MRFLDWILSFIYPNKCPYCKKIIDYKSTECMSCAEKMYSTSFRRIIGDNLICYAPLKYNSIVKNALVEYKFKNQRHYYKSFAKAMVNVSEINNLRFDTVTSVPLSEIRRKNRGYNQSELVAREFTYHYGIPYIETLKKVMENKEQHTLSREERAYNVKGVYDLLDCDISGKTIIICDDIVTTGHTLAECANVLLKRNAKDVICMAVATVD